MSDLRPLAVSVSRLTSEAFSRKFVALGRILSQWADIVGMEMANKTQPVKIHYRKPKTKGEKPQASLDIGASSADAAILHYQKDLILERLNQLYGEKWITSIRFVHIATNSVDFGDYGYIKPQNEPPSQEELKRLDGVLEEIEDEDIRKRLEKLGQSVLRKERSKFNRTSG
ncbi:MAG: DciA family protein [Alphaproteobacteria bacterium]|nr:DciA family protein [Alphaproteobacteria bacterium]